MRKFEKKCGRDRHATDDIIRRRKDEIFMPDIQGKIYILLFNNCY